MTTPDVSPQVVVADAPDASRYEARSGDEVIGFSEYRLAGDVISFLHTEVMPAAEGKGVGSLIARTVLEDARARGLRVRPLCPFIAAYIRRHAEYADLVIRQSGREVTPSA